MNFARTFILFSMVAAGSFSAGTAVSQVSEELTNMTQEGTTRASSAPEAAREIQNSVTSEIARAQAIDILGEKRYLKNKNLVETRIVKQSAKFIPFVNPGIPSQNTDGTWKMAVELRLSKASLRKMILDVGLMNDADGPSAILPMIAFIDRKNGVSLRWWQGEPKDDAHKFLSGISVSFHDRLQTEFSKQGFHLVRPLGTSISALPEPYRADRLAVADQGFVADFFSVPMIMRGDVRFRESRDSAGIVLGAIKLEVVQASSGRTVAEVSRQFETEPGAFEAVIRTKLGTETPEIAKDLATQVLEAWQRGTLSSNLIRLSVRGTLSPKQLTDLKNSLVQNVREVKSLKERAFETGQVLFEVDYTGEPGPLAEKLKLVHLPAFETHVSSATEKGIDLDVKTR
jgi:hypothetical protein